MPDATIDDLNRINDHVLVGEGPGGLPMISVRNDFASARIALQGAHVIDFRPTGGSPVLWVSAHSLFSEGTSIRGGIPICWPWFGPHPEPGRDLPMHGFVRTRNWELVGSSQGEDGQTDLVLRTVSDESTLALWPHAFELEYRIRIGHHLDCRLVTSNPGPEPFTITAALHSYFAVSDIEDIRLRGLERKRYLDRLDGDKKKRQGQTVVVDGPLTRIFIDTEDICYLDDPNLNRCIVIAKDGSRSTVVWNPWIETAKRLTDFGDEEYLEMLCVETSNAGPDSIVIPPGGSHELRALIGVEAFGFSIEDFGD
jgi:D-hexose-6-phosphate mutarotase